MIDDDPAIDYLWDPEREPDPLVASFERALAPFAAKSTPPRGDRGTSPRRLRTRVLAAAAVVAMAIGGGYVYHRLTSAPPVKVAGEAFALTESGREGVALAVGDAVRGGVDGKVLRIGELGFVELDPGASLWIEVIGRDSTHLFLESGRVRAKIDPIAGPRMFQIVTKAATCVDLGCAYELEYDPRTREARVRVDHGQVAFEARGQRVLIPAGASGFARGEGELGTPCFDDAEPTVRKLVRAFDDLRLDDADRIDRAGKLIASIERRRDSLVLWHLLLDADPAVGSLAETALVDLVGIPPEAQAHKQTSGIEPELWLEWLRSAW
ncbi:MAG: hypothetical protein AB7I19_16265 [Planctomycetota bacterium]